MLLTFREEVCVGGVAGTREYLYYVRDEVLVEENPYFFRNASLKRSLEAKRLLRESKTLKQNASVEAKSFN
jgi:hypothetical protein